MAAGCKSLTDSYDFQRLLSRTSAHYISADFGSRERKSVRSESSEESAGSDKFRGNCSDFVDEFRDAELEPDVDKKI